MPIDVDTKGSPGWWMQRLSVALQRELPRLNLLEAYASGRPPLAWGSEAAQTKFYRLQATSRTNFAATIVDAPCERMGLRSVQTAADSDIGGDAEAWALITGNDVDVTIGDAARMAKRFGRSYLATSAPDAAGDPAVITAEDPRLMIHEADPVRPRTIRAAFKLFYDAEAELDVAILWLPGEKWVATRPRKGQFRKPRSAFLLGAPELIPAKFSAASFDMAPFREDGDVTEGFFSEKFDDPEVPVDVIQNPGGVGEFELHTDLLDRINHGILQRVVIATLQAFRQRALKMSEGSEPLQDEDDQGNPINWDQVFEAGPDAFWILPPGGDLWESNQVDLTGILQSVKDDVLHLSAVTGTPMSMFTPDAAAQSAEGAQLMRERLVFKVEDFQRIAGRALSKTIARAFRYMGDESRGDAAKVNVTWTPAERFSLSEKGMAASQVGQTLTWEQTQEIIWQQSPAEVEQAKSQRMQDLMVAAMSAPKPVAPNPPNSPAPVKAPDEPAANPPAA